MASINCRAKRISLAHIAKYTHAIKTYFIAVSNRSDRSTFAFGRKPLSTSYLAREWATTNTFGVYIDNMIIIMFFGKGTLLCVRAYVIPRHPLAVLAAATHGVSGNR